MSIEFWVQTLFFIPDRVINLVMADREEGEVFLMKRYFDKAKLMDGLKHANERDLVVEMVSMLSLDERRVRGVLGVEAGRQTRTG